MRLRALAPIALLGLALGCGGGPSDFDYGSLRDPTRTEYVIGVADKLRVTVWKNADVSTSVKVRPDGTITLPLLGDLEAAGKTPTELKQEVSEALQSFIKDRAASVTVEIVEVNSYRFTVSGEVNQNGVFEAQRYVTVLEAINMAGGFSRFARKDAIRVVRCCDEEGKRLEIPVDYRAIVKSGRTDMNIYLLAGDEVHVP